MFPTMQITIKGKTKNFFYHYLFHYSQKKTTGRLFKEVSVHYLCNKLP